MLWVYWGVLIIPKWLILTPGHIAILFGRFLELPKNRLNLDPRTPYLSPKKIMATPLNNNIFFIYEILSILKLLEGFYVPTVWKFGIWQLEHLMKFSKFVDWAFVNLKIGNLIFEKGRFVNCKFEIGNWQIWKSKIWFFVFEISCTSFLSPFVKMGTGKLWTLVK